MTLSYIFDSLYQYIHKTESTAYEEWMDDHEWSPRHIVIQLIIELEEHGYNRNEVIIEVDQFMFAALLSEMNSRFDEKQTNYILTKENGMIIVPKDLLVVDYIDFEFDTDLTFEHARVIDKKEIHSMLLAQEI